MEVPPGRVERIADGGPEAIRSILAELRAMKFNGVLKTSVFRGDTPSQGVLVLRRGDGVLAEHRSATDVAGHDALPEILKDAASARAQLEVRTYDYGHSSISIDHLQRSYPEAAVEGIGDPDEVLDQAIAQEARERDVYEKQLEARRGQERTLVEREEELYRRKWELEQEYQRSAMRQRELDSLRTELQTVKEASGLILNRLEERRTSRDVEVESQKKVLAIESEKARTELEAQKRSLSERQAKLGGVERELASKEATYRDREASLDARAASLERERKQMNDLYANLQAEAEKISEARKTFDERLGKPNAASASSRARTRPSGTGSRSCGITWRECLSANGSSRNGRNRSLGAWPNSRAGRRNSPRRARKSPNRRKRTRPTTPASMTNAKSSNERRSACRSSRRTSRRRIARSPRRSGRPENVRSTSGDGSAIWRPAGKSSIN